MYLHPYWRASQGSIDLPAGIPPADLGALLRAAQAATGEADLATLVQRLMAIAIEHAAARRGVLLVADPEGDPAGETAASLQSEFIRQSVHPHTFRSRPLIRLRASS